MAVPAAAADAVSVSLLHLEDWGCVSHRNGTHLVVSGPLSQCGTGRRQHRGGTEYVNTVRTARRVRQHGTYRKRVSQYGVYRGESTPTRYVPHGRVTHYSMTVVQCVSRNAAGHVLGIQETG